MKILTWFFGLYRAGKLPTISAITEALRIQRQHDDAVDTSFDRFQGVYKDAPTFDAPKRLKFPSMLQSEAMLRYHDRADWQHVDYALRTFAAKLIEACRKQGIPMYVHAAFRTQAEQDAAHARGASSLTWPHAAHCQGKAVDIVHGKFHWEMTKQEWALIGIIGKKVAHQMGISIEWGGDWKKPWDPAHWEIPTWDKEPILRLKTGAPVRLTPRGILGTTWKSTTVDPRDMLAGKPYDTVPLKPNSI